MPDLPQPKNGEVWTIVLDPVKGHEQGGVRPAVVVSNDRFNRAFETLVIIVPLTRTDRGIPTQIRVDPPEGGMTAPSFIMCEQVRAVSVERFRKRRGQVTAETMQRIEQIVATVTRR